MTEYLTRAAYVIVDYRKTKNGAVTTKDVIDAVNACAPLMYMDEKNIEEAIEQVSCIFGLHKWPAA